MVAAGHQQKLFLVYVVPFPLRPNCTRVFESDSGERQYWDFAGGARLAELVSWVTLYTQIIFNSFFALQDVNVFSRPSLHIWWLWVQLDVWRVGNGFGQCRDHTVPKCFSACGPAYLVVYESNWTFGGWVMALDNAAITRYITYCGGYYTFSVTTYALALTLSSRGTLLFVISTSG